MHLADFRNMWQGFDLRHCTGISPNDAKSPHKTHKRFTTEIWTLALSEEKKECQSSDSSSHYSSLEIVLFFNICCKIENFLHAFLKRVKQTVNVYLLDLLKLWRNRTRLSLHLWLGSIASFLIYSTHYEI